MKTLISNNGGYKVYAEIIKPVRDVGSVQLKFSTQYESSKHPNEFQEKFAAMFTPEELEILKSIL